MEVEESAVETEESTGSVDPKEKAYFSENGQDIPDKQFFMAEVKAEKERQVEEGMQPASLSELGWMINQGSDWMRENIPDSTLPMGKTETIALCAAWERVLEEKKPGFKLSPMWGAVIITAGTVAPRVPEAFAWLKLGIQMLKARNKDRSVVSEQGGGDGQETESRAPE